MEKVAETAQKGLSELSQRCDILDKDNDLLRTQIASTSCAQEPLREEQFYVSQFDQIRMEIESWAAKETRGKVLEPVTTTCQDTVIAMLVVCGDHGKLAGDLLRSASSLFGENRRTRIALIRHATAVWLYSMMFDRFAFGFNSKMSDQFKNVETTIYSQSSPITNYI